VLVAKFRASSICLSSFHKKINETGAECVFGLSKCVKHVINTKFASSRLKNLLVLAPYFHI